MIRIDRRTTLALPALLLADRAHAQGAPASYPQGYQDVVAGAEREGSLLIYSIMSAENWRPVLEGFNRRYPRVRVETLDLPNSREVFERYLAERGTNSRTADLLATADPGGWIEFQARGEVLPYESAESAAWPAWAKPWPGVYTISADPLVFIFNKMTVPEAQQPKSFAQFVTLATQNQARWRNKITSYGAHNGGFGYSSNFGFVQKHGEKAWDWFKELAPLRPRWERSGGPMTEKVTSGEYAAGWFVSAITFWPRLNDPARARVLGWNFIEDGQLVILRGMAIAKAARNVNAAKLMIDYIASAEGQAAFGRGGLTPARPGVMPGEGIRHTYSSIVQAVGGEQNIAFIDYNKAMLDDYQAFIDRWKSAYGVS
ncbi:ABC transporter substrate-binding protein [Humitalea sp. 24SJ18S-53]|uniref:ABC transporter substrate-binding protein n=1 Tax=Humitalea sp. 24SJ18S-53 TaxID=3422307 RepID=UPI003D664073